MRHRGGDAEPEGLCDFAIDKQLELCCLLDRYVGRLGTFEDSVDKDSRVPKLFDIIRPIGREATSLQRTPFE